MNNLNPGGKQSIEIVCVDKYSGKWHSLESLYEFEEQGVTSFANDHSYVDCYWVILVDCKEVFRT